MNFITRPTAAALLLLLSTTLTATTAAQQKRQTPAKPQPKATVAPTPAPTFETLLPADSYTLYGEVRGAGQLIRSNTVNELLEPILKLAAPPKEFKSIVKWLNAHADELMTSRLLVATSAIANNVPSTIVAIEFASAEEAAKFATPLTEFLPTVLPTPYPEHFSVTAGESNNSAPAEKPKPTTPAKPEFHLQRLGSLVVITPRPWTMKQLKPAGSKLLAENVNFRAARNRFNSEPIFVFIDVRAMERQQEEERKKWQEEAIQMRAREAAAREEAKKTEEKVEEPQVPELTAEEKAALEAQALAQLQAVPSPEAVKETAAPDPVTTALSMLTSSFFGGQADWPDGVGLALSFEGDSFDIRALLVNQAGEKSDTIPFAPMLIPGPAFTPESPNIFPADTELFVTMSLDLPQIYSAMSKSGPPAEFISSERDVVNVKEVEVESPFAVLESKLKIKIKDDLLPLLGSEIAIRLPVKNMSLLGLPVPTVPMASVTVEMHDLKDDSTTEPPSRNAGSVLTAGPVLDAAGPVLAIAVKDKEGLKALLPKLIDNFGFKGASSLAQTERKEDTEIVSFANLFSYAFVGNFLVLSADPATTRHVVDSYLKRETLAGDTHFRSYTRWQPRPSQGQLYISPSLMETYKIWAEKPNTRISDQMRAFFARVTAVAQPITYSLSNEGLGPLHELHLPKNLVLMAAAGLSSAGNPEPVLQNERLAIGMMYTIAHAQQQYKTTKGAGSCGTLEQLIAADLIPTELIEKSGYRFDLTVSGDKFEATAVPVEYGKSGSLSLFIDQTRVLRGGDRNGASATSADPPIQ